MKRYLALVFALLFVLALFAGCGGNNNTANKTTNNNNTDKGAAATDNSGTASPEATDDEDSPYKFAAGKFPADANGIATAKYEYELPLTTTDETFTYWTTNFTPEYLPEEGYGATALPMEVEARTGVKVEYIVVASAARAENFSVLAASDELCDITCNANMFYSGNFRDAVETDEFFINVFDYRQYMPNYMYEATRDPDDIDTIRTVFTEDDLVLLVYELKKEGQLTSGGFMRGDWLAKMGKTYTDIVTFDDLHEVLMFFKSQLGIATPTSIYKTINVVGCNEWVGYDTYALCSGVPQSVVVNGKVQLANMTQNDLDLMTMINQWYNDGIIDPNWSSYTGCADLNDKIKSSEVGYILAGGISIAAHDDVIPPDAEVGWVPVAMPLREEGQTLHLGYNLPRVYWGSAAISTKCENIPLVCTWLDWRYGEEGSFLYGYGVEGVSYEYDEDGNLWLLDEIVNHPAYWGMIMCTHSLNHVVEAGLKIDYTVNLKINAKVPEYLAFWMSVPHDNAYVFPSGVSYTAEQTAELAKYGADVGTYVEENYMAFVDGSKPLSDWQNYVDGLYAIGVQNIIDIRQAAYDAYMSK